jgi:hypothetical protein
VTRAVTWPAMITTDSPLEKRGQTVVIMDKTLADTRRRRQPGTGPRSVTTDPAQHKITSCATASYN